MTQLYFKLLFLTFYFVQSHSMMMRNDALISKMVSNFQKDNTLAAESAQNNEQQQQQPKSVLTMMQNVLCKNFPSVPCDMIVEDEMLRKLIERSIQQLKYKKLSIEKTTPMPGYHLTLFPSINSEDLSNFLQVSETGYFSKGKLNKGRVRRHKKKFSKNTMEQQIVEREPKKKSKVKKDSSRTTLYNGRKKIRKFYPHKIKYKDKLKGRKDFGDYSEEKLSMSVEVPDMNMQSRKSMNYKSDPADPPVWRIDYMKHGEPSLNMFNYEPDRLKEKLVVKTGPNVIVSDNMLEQGSRKDVLHPDVYIKKNFIRKNDMNSGGMDDERLG